MIVEKYSVCGCRHSLEQDPEVRPGIVICILFKELYQTFEPGLNERFMLCNSRETLGLDKPTKDPDKLGEAYMMS